MGDQADVRGETESDVASEANGEAANAQAEVVETAYEAAPSLLDPAASTGEPESALDIDSAVDRAAPGEALRDPLAELAAGIVDIRSVLEEGNRIAQAFHSRAAAQEDLINRLHAKMTQLEAGESRSLLKPLVNGLAQLHGEIESQGRVITREVTPEELNGILAVLAARVENMMSLLGFEVFGAEPGDQFTPRRHHAVGSVPTTQPELDQRIGAVLRKGFDNPSNPRDVIVAHVSVHRYQPLAAPAKAFGDDMGEVSEVPISNHPISDPDSPAQED